VVRTTFDLPPLAQLATIEYNESASENSTERHLSDPQ
jgi:hypothetical protein